MRRNALLRRAVLITAVAALSIGAAAGPALACGGLIAPNGTINLLRTATLAGYVDGVEHYVTSFEFAGGGAEFGSIIPLPGIPSRVKRGGDWTLQRLQQEVAPVFESGSGADAAGGSVALQSAEVILETSVDALDITILKGGGDEVGIWAKENGFQLPPDAPEVLDFYADRSPIFMAARFDVRRAERLGRGVGDGIPVHLVIPTPDPWVPLRILGLGRQPGERIEADVFLLTENKPSLLPAPRSEGVVLERSQPASDLLLADLRSDKGMKWIPTEDMHLSYLKIDETAGELTHDLAIDATGTGTPSYVAAGLTAPSIPWRPSHEIQWSLWLGMAMMIGAIWIFIGRTPSKIR